VASGYFEIFLIFFDRLFSFFVQRPSKKDNKVTDVAKSDIVQPSKRRCINFFIQNGFENTTIENTL
jgi:hypothetical protein